MKKVLKISCCTLFLILGSQICTSQPSKFQIAIEGGPSLTFVRDYNTFFSTQNGMNYKKEWIHSVDYSMGVGGTIGCAFRVNFTKKISLSTNLSYERKGWQTSEKFHERWDYLILPILFRCNLGKKNICYINAGPYIGYLLSHSIKFENYEPYRDDSGFHRFDFGVSAGVGFNIPIYHHFSLTIEIRDNLGLYNVNKEIYNANIYFNSLVLQSGLVYNFIKK